MSSDKLFTQEEIERACQEGFCSEVSVNRCQTVSNQNPDGAEYVPMKDLIEFREQLRDALDEIRSRHIRQSMDVAKSEEKTMSNNKGFLLQDDIPGAVAADPDLIHKRVEEIKVAVAHDCEEYIGQTTSDIVYPWEEAFNASLNDLKIAVAQVREEMAKSEVGLGKIYDWMGIDLGKPELKSADNSPCVCTKCGENFPYATANQANGSFVCYSCKLRW